MKTSQQLLYLFLFATPIAMCVAQPPTGNERSRTLFAALLPDEKVTTEIARGGFYSVCVGNDSLVKDRCLVYGLTASDPVNAFLIDEKLYNERLDAEEPVTADLGISGSQCNAKACLVKIDETGTDHWCIVVQNTKPWSVFMTFFYKGCLDDEEKQELAIIIISVVVVIGLAILVFCGCCCYLFWKREGSKRHRHSHTKDSPSPCGCPLPVGAQVAIPALVGHPVDIQPSEDKEHNKKTQQSLPLLV